PAAAEGAREVRDQFSKGEAARGWLEYRCFGPAARLDGESRRNRREAVSRGDELLLHPTDRVPVVDDALRLPILRTLEVRIHQVVQRVELLEHGVCVPRGDSGSTVGPDRLLPEPEADEDVRRHVL